VIQVTEVHRRIEGDCTPIGRRRQKLVPGPFTLRAVTDRSAHPLRELGGNGETGAERGPLLVGTGVGQEPIERVVVAARKIPTVVTYADANRVTGGVDDESNLAAPSTPSVGEQGPQNLPDPHRVTERLPANAEVFDVDRCIAGVVA